MSRPKNIQIDSHEDAQIVGFAGGFTNGWMETHLTARRVRLNALPLHTPDHPCIHSLCYPNNLIDLLFIKIYDSWETAAKALVTAWLYVCEVGAAAVKARQAAEEMIAAFILRIIEIEKK